MTTSIAKAAALASVIVIGAVANPAPAEAGRGGRAIAAGVLGFAAGAIIAGSAARAHRGHGAYYYEDQYYTPPPRRVYFERNYYAAPYAHHYSPEPWTPDWYSYCHSKYRSFDPRSGTYQPYYGPRRFCR